MTDLSGATDVESLSERQVKAMLKDIKDDQLDAFFESEGSQSSTKPWQGAEWEERRKEKLDDRCAWCGDEEELQLHHIDHRKPNWNREWIRIENEEFEASNDFDPASHLEGREQCPRCGKKNYYERTTMTPAYRCQSCDAEFAEPEILTPEALQERGLHPTKTTQYYRDKLRWVSENVSSVYEAFGDRYRDYWEEYLSLEDTVTICKQCHYMYHERGMAICAFCGDQYAKYRDREFNRYVCWDCVVEEKGLEECPQCEENWYDPTHNDACSSCRSP